MSHPATNVPAMEMRTDRVGLLLDQHESSVGISRERLAGLTDEEYRWEPVPDCWSIRRRGEAASPDPFGPGEWLLDWDDGHPQPDPFTTIAWRLGHLISMYVDRWEWTFGSRSIDPARMELVAQRCGDGAFARPGKPGQPDGEAHASQ